MRFVPIMTMVAWVLAAAAAAAPGTGVPGAAARPEVRTGAAREWRALASPWFEERRLAQQRLAHLAPADGLLLARQLCAEADPRLRLAAARWLIERFERGPVVPEERVLLRERCAVEDEPRVLEALLHAAARDAEVAAWFLAQDRAPGDGAAARGRLLEARLVVTLESVMHEGRVPGFFDGQFATVRGAGEGSYARLVLLAWDPRVHFVIRALAVMALHETRNPALAVHLGPLIDVPLVEIDQVHRVLQRVRVDERTMREYVHARLSQYARFSLAKAGIAGPIEEKIRFLESEVEKALKIADAFRSSGNEALAGVYVERAMSYSFELGYHHQQLDRYDQAEREYRRIIAGDGEALSTRWAYYNLACIRAIQGRTEEALAELEKAVKAGFKDTSWARRDGDLEPLRADPRFHKILSELEGGGPEESATPETVP